MKAIQIIIKHQDGNTTLINRDLKKPMTDPERQKFIQDLKDYISQKINGNTIKKV